MAERPVPGLELPGADLIEQGIADLREKRETEAALAVATAAPRLRAAGLEVPRGGRTGPPIASMRCSRRPMATMPTVATTRSCAG